MRGHYQAKWRHPWALDTNTACRAQEEAIYKLTIGKEELFSRVSGCSRVCAPMRSGGQPGQLGPRTTCVRVLSDTRA